MTPDIEQLCREALKDDKRATPGPWRQGNVETYHVFCPYAGALAPELGRVLLRMNTHFEHEADTAFIAAARTREPLLAKALLAEREETERLRAEVVRLSKRAERPAAEYVCTQCSATMRSWQDFPEYQHVDCGGLVRLRACIERDAIRAQLTAMTAARDEACDLAAKFRLDGAMFPHMAGKRIAELRAVGKERP